MTTEAAAFIDATSLTDLSDLARQALADAVLLEAMEIKPSGAEFLAKCNPKRCKLLGDLIWRSVQGNRTPGRRVEKFLGIPAVRIAPPAPTADDFAEGM